MLPGGGHSLSPGLGLRLHLLLQHTSQNEPGADMGWGGDSLAALSCQNQV